MHHFKHQMLSHQSMGHQGLGHVQELLHVREMLLPLLVVEALQTSLSVQVQLQVVQQETSYSITVELLENTQRAEQAQ